MSIYRIKLSQGDKLIEVEGDKKFVLETIKKYWLQNIGLNGKTMDIIDHTKKEKASTIDKKNQAAGEFIRMLGLKRHTEYVLAFGYYLEKYVSMKDFARADINKCYYDAKMESSNTSQMLALNIKSGRIMYSKSQKGKEGKFYTLTQTGIDYIEKILNKKN